MTSTSSDPIVTRPKTADALGVRDSSLFKIVDHSDNQCQLRQPLVSFVLINLNYGHFVGAAIESIKNQDYTNFECMVIDNHSDDNSLAVIKRHIEGDARFSLREMEANRGQLGAALWALDYIRGGFVVFVDADDILLPTFCSMHVQVHLALARNVAFTSSDVFEINKDREILSSHYSRLMTGNHLKPSLRKAALVPRVFTISEQTYEILAEQTFILNKSDWGWIWSPGTSNMFRASILKLLFFDRDSPVLMRAADGHFNVLAHALGGSATINIPLSAYRIHGGNYFVKRESIYGLTDGSREYSLRDLELSYQSLEILVSRADQFWWLAEPTFWETIDCATRADTPERLRLYYRSPAARMLFERNATKILKAMGFKAFALGIFQRFGFFKGVKIILIGLIFG
jgi:glycosyltransferase involved in cell wall biosynthesis